MNSPSETAVNESPAPLANSTATHAACRASAENRATRPRTSRRAARKPTTFEPSERQQQLAEILATDKDALTITSLCEKAGVTRNTFYRWQRDGKFQLWLARIAMQTLLATSPMLLMQGVNDALNGDFRAWRTMLNFAYNPRGLAALDAFLARLEENARLESKTSSELEPDFTVEDGASPASTVTNSAAGEPATPHTTPAGATITTAARVVRDLRRSAAKCHTPAPPKPKFEVSYKYTPPPSKPAAHATASEPAATARTEAPSTSTSPESTPPTDAPAPASRSASSGPQPDASFPAAEIAALVERARKLTPTEIAKAAFNGEFGLVKLALSEGADPNSRDDVYGVSALSAAAATGKIEVMRLLLRRGADLNSRDNQGRTALDHARRQNQHAAAQVLLEAGAR